MGAQAVLLLLFPLIMVAAIWYARNDKRLEWRRTEWTRDEKETDE